MRIRRRHRARAFDELLGRVKSGTLTEADYELAGGATDTDRAKIHAPEGAIFERIYGQVGASVYDQARPDAGLDDPGALREEPTE
jgi:hypothetical protein